MKIRGIKIKEINKACLGFTGGEILGIKWISFKSIDPSVTLEGPKLYFHIRLKDGKEKYIPLHKNTYYPITCEEHKEINIPSLAIH
ncbi:hypothetical protein E3V08_01330 [Candidatus Atribacteria bacterium MT.SAG.1]|nr:hypothetical protein E3V08_01330 [Candidatus Atribacteria bacterium MT.SAG.1]